MVGERMTNADDQVDRESCPFSKSHPPRPIMTSIFCPIVSGKAILVQALLKVMYTVFQKSDAKIEITITRPTSNLIRIKNSSQQL